MFAGGRSQQQAQIADQAVATHQLGAHRRIEGAHDIATGRLGGIQRQVGILEQAIGIGMKHIPGGDTQTRPHLDGGLLVLPDRAQRLQQGLRHRLALGHRVGAVDQQGEFVTAQPGQHMRGRITETRHADRQPARDLAQQAIADRMTEGVVDLLEVVEIQQAERQHRRCRRR